MREITLTAVAKKLLMEAYGENAVKIDKELNELAKLVIKRKDFIKSFNKGHFRFAERYIELDLKITKIIKKINKKLSA